MLSFRSLPRSASLWLSVAISALWFHADARAADATKTPAIHEEVPSETETRVAEPGWWPTKGGAARNEYIGSTACARCHGDKVESYAATQMAHAMAPIASKILPELAGGPLRQSFGSVRYELSASAEGTIYSVSNGMKTISSPLGWVFGTGEIGRTYVYQQNSVFYESHVSYYTSLQGLDFTTGHSRSVPASLTAALGRQITSPRVCFACHSTESTTSEHFDAQNLVPGVTCEACHGPGAQHVAVMSAAEGAQTPSMIFNPARLGPVAAVDFCGACHRTSVDVSFLGISGIATLRFPAYRLEGSRCWTKPDARLTCFACHDPHQPLVRETTSYDKNCLACHSGSSRSGAGLNSQSGSSVRNASAVSACPVAKNNCVSCHMPKYRVDDMHATFTDHTIAIHHERTASAK
jgi:hypothetical protein